MQALLKRALGALLLTALAQAVCAEDAQIKSMSYSTNAIAGFDVINVYSSDGQEWDTLAGPPVKFTADMDVDTKWPGYVEAWGIFNGWCVDLACGQRPLIHTESSFERDLQLYRQFEIAMDEIPITTDNGIATTPLGDEILQVCNDQLSNSGATDLYVFNRNVWTSFSVNTRKSISNPSGNPQQVPDPGGDYEPEFGGGDETRQAPFVVQVRCNPYDFEEDFEDDLPNKGFAIEDVELFLSTFSNEVTHPDPDTECKKGRVLVRVKTNQAGPVAMRLWTATPDIQDEWIETWSSHVGSGNYEAEVIRWISVYETTFMQAMVAVENGFADLQAGWDDLTLECITDTPDFRIDPPPADDPDRQIPGLVSR